MKSSTLERNGIARFFGGIHFPFFAKFVFSAVIMIREMPATFGLHSPKETFVSRLINLNLNVQPTEKAGASMTCLCLLCLSFPV